MSKTLLLEHDEDSQFLSTGITCLDLACYGQIGKGFKKGHIYRIAGKSSSGKTFMGRTILAEAANNENFDGYELIYDDVERGALMDTAKYFGQKLTDRLIPPARKGKEPVYSYTIADFYKSLRAKLDKGKSLVWIEDSMDSLASADEKENKMSDGKAKVNSQELRKIIEPLEKTGSILVLVSQAHVDMRSMFGGDLAAGGRALEFYSTLDIWLNVAKRTKKKYKGVDYHAGSIISARVKKNRLSGRDRTVYFPFDPDFGIDDIGANVDFLRRSKHWTSGEGSIDAPEFDFNGTRRDLIKQIETDGSAHSLKILVAQVWKEIQDALTEERQPRYS